MFLTHEGTLTIEPVSDSTGTASPSASFGYNPLKIYSLLYSSGDSTYRLRFPIHVLLEDTGEQCIVTTSLLPVYGAGVTQTEAIADFQSMLIDYFIELDDSQHVLAHHLLRDLGIMRLLIENR